MMGRRPGGFNKRHRLGSFVQRKCQSFTEVHRIYTPSSLGGEFQEAQWETQLKPSGTKTEEQKTGTDYCPDVPPRCVATGPGHSFVGNKRLLQTSAGLQLRSNTAGDPGGSDM